jgi:hypothetical protein
MLERCGNASGMFTTREFRPKDSRLRQALQRSEVKWRSVRIEYDGDRGGTHGEYLDADRKIDVTVSVLLVAHYCRGAEGQRGVVVRCAKKSNPLQAVFLDLLVEIASGHRELACCFADVPRILSQFPQEKCALGVLLK